MNNFEILEKYKQVIKSLTTEYKEKHGDVNVPPEFEIENVEDYLAYKLFFTKYSSESPTITYISRLKTFTNDIKNKLLNRDDEDASLIRALCDEIDWWHQTTMIADAEACYNYSCIEHCFNQMKKIISK